MYEAGRATCIYECRSRSLPHHSHHMSYELLLSAIYFIIDDMLINLQKRGLLYTNILYYILMISVAESDLHE